MQNWHKTNTKLEKSCSYAWCYIKQNITNVLLAFDSKDAPRMAFCTMLAPGLACSMI